MSTKISVIIPFFNGEKYLEECVDSVTSQTLKEIEIILVDDGSVDSSAAISKRLMSEDGRIKFIRQENKGVSTARNVAIKEAIGEYLMFVDADDRLKQDACEVLYNAVVQADCDIVTGEYELFNDEKCVRADCEGKTEKIYSHDDIKKISLNMGENCFFQYAWRRLFSSRLIKENSIEFHPDIAIGEDTLFCLESFLRAKHALYVPVTVYEYRQNTQGVMRSQKYNKKMTPSLLLQYDEKKKLCKRFLPEYEQVFLKGAALFSYKSGCGLLFDNVFHKGDGDYGEFSRIIHSRMIRDMFKYFDINDYRSKSLDWVALKLISMKLNFLAYIVEKIMYRINKRRKNNGNKTFRKHRNS